MLITLVQVQAGQSVAADAVLGQPTLDSQLHSIVGAVLHHDAGLGLLQTADPAGYTVVALLIQLVAGQNSLVGVDDDDIVTSFNVGSEINFVLAAQQVGGDNSSAAQGLASCVENVPLALYGLLLSQSSGQYAVLQYVKIF